MKTLSNAFKLATVISFIGWLARFVYPMSPQTARTVVFTVAVTLLCTMYTVFVFFLRGISMNMAQVQKEALLRSPA